MIITSINTPACRHTAVSQSWTCYGDPKTCHPVSDDQQRHKETDGPKENINEFTPEHFVV